MNAPDRDHMLELVAAYALGVLPAADHALVAAFILSDPDARAEYDDLRGASSLLGLIAEEPVDTARAARMKERLLATVRADAAPTSARVATRAVTRSSAIWGTGLAAAAALAFALISVIQNFSLRSDLHESQRRVTALQTQATSEHRRVERDDRILADLTAGDAKQYPVVYGKVVKRGTHVYLALSALPPVPRGKVYQAWTVARGTTAVTPSVTFTPSANGVTLVPMPEDASKLSAVALTVEPEGGSKTPTTKPSFLQPLT